MADISLGPPSQSGIAGVPGFPGGAFAVSPSDSNTWTSPVAVYVGTTGDVRVIPFNGGSPVTFMAVPAGACVPCSVRAVLSTSTTASNLVGVY